MIFLMVAGGGWKIFVRIGKRTKDTNISRPQELHPKFSRFSLEFGRYVAPGKSSFVIFILFIYFLTNLRRTSFEEKICMKMKRIWKKKEEIVYRWLSFILAKDLRTARTYQRLQTISSSNFFSLAIQIWN